MITFVGAGPGAEDLITVRGQRLLKEADIVIYAGSLVNPGLLKLCKEKCEIYNSAKMTLEEVLEVMVKGHGDGKEIVRLHTGDPCLYGAIREQTGSGIHTSGNLPVSCNYENGWKNAGAGERIR